jgi:hypothetical protein
MNSEKDKRSDWQRTSKTIAGRKCIQHKITGEQSLELKHGSIWEDAPDYKACVVNHYIANKLCRFLNQPAGYRLGDEAVIRLKESEIELAIQLLRPIRTQTRQISSANQFRNPSGVRKTPLDTALKDVISGQARLEVQLTRELSKIASKTPSFVGSKAEKNDESSVSNLDGRSSNGPPK